MHPDLITVSVTGPDGTMLHPGDTDPAVPQPILDTMQDVISRATDAIMAQAYKNLATNLYRRIQQMQRGGSNKWWNPYQRNLQDDMTYECDASLGNPALADCTRIQWHGLGSGSVEIGPAEPKFFSSGKSN